MKKSHAVPPFSRGSSAYPNRSPRCGGRQRKVGHRTRSPVAAAYFRSQREPGQTDHVVARLEVGGETKYTDEGKPKREKMSVLCDLDYVEKTLETPTGSEAVWRAVRDYQKVSADVKVGDGQFKPTLKPEHRLIAVEAARQTTLLFSPGGSLTRDELDAIDIQANTLLLDRLLPEKPVAVGDRWPHSAELLAALLGLDEVAKTTVQSTLKEVTEHGRPVRVHRPGRGDHLRRLDRPSRSRPGIASISKRSGSTGWACWSRRTAQGSFVATGWTPSRGWKSSLLPPRSRPAWPMRPWPGSTLKPTPELLDLTHQSPGRLAVHLRSPLVPALSPSEELGGRVEVCRIAARRPGSALRPRCPQRDPDKLVSLEEFQEDVRRALGKSFGEFVEAGQSSNDGELPGLSRGGPRHFGRDCHAVDLLSRGRSAGPPGGLHVSRRAALVDRFAEADKPLVESLRFVEKEKRNEKNVTEKERCGEAEGR